MAKFINLWEGDASKMPADPRQRAEIFGKLIEMTKKMLAEGKISDWGQFAGGGGGYVIAEGTAMDILKMQMLFAPYIKSHVHPVLSVDEVAEVMKSMKG